MVNGYSRASLSETQRKAYTDAVLCLQKLPALTPTSLVPGVRSRYDDFVASHINQSLSIHYTGNFLSWHRWYTYQYELALKNECGYTGSQPCKHRCPLTNSAFIEISNTKC